MRIDQLINSQLKTKYIFWKLNFKVLIDKMTRKKNEMKNDKQTKKNPIMIHTGKKNPKIQYSNKSH